MSCSTLFWILPLLSCFTPKFIKAHRIRWTSCYVLVHCGAYEDLEKYGFFWSSFSIFIGQSLGNISNVLRLDKFVINMGNTPSTAANVVIIESKAMLALKITNRNNSPTSINNGGRKLCQILDRVSLSHTSMCFADSALMTNCLKLSFTKCHPQSR